MGRFWNATGQALVDRFAETVARLAAARPDLLILDITGNGGGTDWGDAAVRTLTPKPLHCPPGGAVRHEHHAALARRDLDGLEELLRVQGITRDDRVHLEDAIASVRRLQAELQTPCDRSRIWEQGIGSLGCSQLAIDPSNCGPLEYLAPGELSTVERRRIVFGPLRYVYAEGIYDGPLAVLVDESTASASEGVASLLQGNGAAMVVGTRTLGAGCGYVDGGIPVTLDHCGWTVRMPDCVRFRMDGVNEIEGIEPNVSLYEPEDGSGDRLQAVVGWLEQELLR